MARIERKTKRSPTDLSDEERGQIEPLLPKPPARERKPSVDLREVLNAIRYMTRTGGVTRGRKREQATRTKLSLERAEKSAGAP
ncbi:MAG: transposase [Brucella intermedia]